MADATNRCGTIGCYVDGPHSHGTTTGGNQVENKLRWRIAGLEAKVKRLRTRDLAMKEQEAEVERLRGDYETSHASRVHADTAVLDLEAENERLRAQVDTLTDVIERIGTTAEARIEAALALLESIPPHERGLELVKAIEALKGEKP